MNSLIFAAALLISTSAFADSQYDAYKSLKRIEASFEIGASYSEFTDLMRDAKLNLNLYLDESNMNKKSEIRKLISASFSHYDNARTYLAHKHDTGEKFVSEGSTLAQSFFEKYPSTINNIYIYNQEGLSDSEQEAAAMKNTNENHLLAIEEVFTYKNQTHHIKQIHIDSMVQHALRSASRNLKDTSLQLSKSKR